MLSKLKGVFFGLFFLLSSFLIFLFFLPVSWTKLPYRLCKYLIAKSFLFGLKVIGISYNINSVRDLKLNNPTILVGNHQSTWDCIIFLLLLKKVSYIIKQEVYSIPLLGPSLKVQNMIFVDRDGGGRSVIKMIHDCKEKLSEGFSIVIFPQGTRVLPGESSYDSYKFGFLKLHELDYDIIPFNLDSGNFFGRNIFSPKKSGTITLNLFNRIAYNKEGNKEELKKRIVDTIENGKI